jgi:NADPH:quinone reductase-like Zn-dependent oxidoreductase
MRSLEVADQPIPVPENDQVLIKVKAAPCNPSDIAFMRGGYGITKPVPAVMGFECTGVVTEAGPDPAAQALSGLRVSCFGRENDGGTWAEYFLTAAGNCLVVKNDLPEDQAAVLCINPFTAYALIETALAKESRAFIQNGASGQIGIFLRSLARLHGLKVINLVRKEEHIRMLEEEGERYNISLNDPDACSRLEIMARELQATIAFDAVGGDVSGLILNSMPAGSDLVVYGGLSGKPLSQFNPLDIIFKSKTIRGFNLGDWKKELEPEKLEAVTERVQQLVADGYLQTRIQGAFPLENVQQAMEQYIRNMSAGKILFRP